MFTIAKCVSSRSPNDLYCCYHYTDQKQLSIYIFLKYYRYDLVSSVVFTFQIIMTQLNNCPVYLKYFIIIKSAV